MHGVRRSEIRAAGSAGAAASAETGYDNERLNRFVAANINCLNTIRKPLMQSLRLSPL